MRERFWELDAARGLAVVLMIVFHFVWDLNRLGFVGGDVYAGFWGLWQKATATLFLLVVGVTLVAARPEKPVEVVPKMLGRAARVFAAGLLVSLVSWIFFPDFFIYFGVLHLIGIAVVLSIPLLDFKKANLALAAILLGLWASIGFWRVNVPALGVLGLGSVPPTLDFFPLIPWLAPVWAGIALGNYWLRSQKRVVRLAPFKNRFSNLFQWLGQNALAIYFIHQVILLGLFWGWTGRSIAL